MADRRGVRLDGSYRGFCTATRWWYWIGRGSFRLGLSLAAFTLLMEPNCRLPESKPLGTAMMAVHQPLAPVFAAALIDLPVAPAASTLAIPEEPAPAVQIPEPAPAPPVAPEVVAPAPAQPGAAVPFDPEIEQWRPLVRELLAEARSEGRLSGAAGRLNEDVVLALIEQESGGDPEAYSWAGAIGLAQVMPFTYADMLYGNAYIANQIGEAAMFEPRGNLRAGLRYLILAMHELDGDLYWVLSSYNAGIGTVQDWQSVGLTQVPPIGGYTETAGYAPAILSNYLDHRSDVGISIPPPMTGDQVAQAIAALESAGLW